MMPAMEIIATAIMPMMNVFAINLLVVFIVN